jgi:hypothetical protein
VFILTQLICLSNSFSIPGLVPTNYQKGDNIPILVGQLTSEKTAMAFNFYDLNWCDNTKGHGFDTKPVAQNYKGNYLVHSPYDVSDSNLTISVYIWSPL